MMHIWILFTLFVSDVCAYTVKDHITYGKAYAAAQEKQWDAADALLSDMLVNHHDDPQLLYDE
ncbi:MAG TPA: hypothetical protein VEK38_01915, partial [Candidatus Bathyarchaeia archaeon]|nr:hypothetical protein [Candidatus Bathyarchaeia archaeon]